MITGELKNKVDRIWEHLWTGGITNPIEVLGQLTYLLYMKMLDDKQISDESWSNLSGVPLKNPIFLEGTWENPKTGNKVAYADMRWQNFKNLSSANMFAMVKDNVFEFIKTIGGNKSAYSRFMSNAIFFIPNEHILQDVVDGIEGLGVKVYNPNPLGESIDTIGDVYEYCLSKMQTSGVNGQFRTPSHIIDMIVELMQPTYEDKICDPAMGTAGFLVSSLKYIHKNDMATMMREDLQLPNRASHINGFDTDQTMLRIGAMNLLLLDEREPNLAQRDSVSTDNEDKKLYTLVLANPPFKGTVNKNMINPELTAMVKTAKTELLFLCQFIRSLQLGGRCACIVPDGVLFGSSSAHKEVRKNLIDMQCLKAVISMPSGVFKPYAGVSTAILIFTRTDNGGTDKVWFYDMKADGFSLDDKRQAINDNDIPDIIKRYHDVENEASRSRKDQSFLVPVEEIRENDYDLSINKYKEIERVKVEYESVEVLLDQLDHVEADYIKGYSELAKMLEK